MMKPSGLVTINQKQMPDFSNPIGLLVHCHERIEGQLSILESGAKILRAGDSRAMARVFEMIDAACAHFALAGVKHTEDEELSLFPRLRQRGGNAGAEALAAMAELESQHRRAEQLHTDIDELVARLPRDGSADLNELDTLSELVAELTMLYRPHILLENNLVFPVAADILPAGEIQALGLEMRERRKDILQRLMAPAS